MNVELKHVWELPRDSVVIRFYMWLWDANPSDVTFCKLFWGYMFAIPALLFVCLIAFPVLRMLDVIKRKMPPSRIPTLEDRERQRARKNRRQDSLKKIENCGVRFVMVFTSAWRFLRYPFVFACGFVVAGAIAFLIYQVSTVWSDVTVNVLQIVGELILAMVFVVIPVALAFVWLIRHGNFNWMGRTFSTATPKIVTTIIAPFVFFAWVMKMGFISVKSNTCPRVVLTDSNPDPE